MILYFSEEDSRKLLIAAFRYAIEHPQYARPVARCLRAAASEMLVDDHKLIATEISFAIGSQRAGSRELDVPLWRSVQRAMRAE